MMRDDFFKKNTHSWANNVRKLLQSSGFHEVWLYPGSININVFMPVLRRRLLDIYISEWNTDINHSTSLYLFREIKTNFEISDYLNKITNVKFRNTLAKIRLSSHSLKIEIGRHEKIERHLRKCTLCNLKDIEDEFHFVLVCPNFAELRETYIERFYYRRPNMFKLTHLLNSSNVRTLNNLALYCIKAFEKRKYLLEYNYV